MLHYIARLREILTEKYPCFTTMSLMMHILLLLVNHVTSSRVACTARVKTAPRLLSQPRPDVIDAPAVSLQARCLPISLTSSSLHLSLHPPTLPQRLTPAPAQARRPHVAAMPHAFKAPNRWQKVRSIRVPRIAKHGQSRLRWHPRPAGIRSPRLRLRQGHARLAFLQVSAFSRAFFA